MHLSSLLLQSLGFRDEGFSLNGPLANVRGGYSKTLEKCTCNVSAGCWIGVSWIGMNTAGHMELTLMG